MDRRRALLLALLALLGALAACHRGVRYQRPEDFRPLPRVAPGWRQRGIASWYGRPFHGRPTASGEIYDMDRLSCAHKTLPLGTVVEVTNLANGRRLRLRVNDRGPYVHGRILDCSRAAARRLGFLEQGTAPVEIRVVRPGSGVRVAAARTTGYALQVGAFADPARARALARRLAADGHEGRIEAAVVGGRRLLRVRTGRYPSKAAAARAAATLYAEGYDVYLAPLR
ncbi:MAG: septal ring lytic transglycosylase RlpA family protein [Nitrospirae bacterium]|nr:MAG: septal ring lytic transglycosylase RlpA family protein [Nitrospirota bacterium]